MRIHLAVYLLLVLSSTAHSLMTTEGNVVHNSDDSYTLSTAAGAVNEATIESLLGLPAGKLDTISSGNVIEGSAAIEAITIVAGERFHFDWFWTSNEGPGSAVNDLAFILMRFNGNDIGSQPEIIADTFTLDGTTGHFDWSPPVPGILTFGVGVVDVADNVGTSIFTIHASVIEPSLVALFGLGFASLIYIRKRSQRIKI